ncbi:hypothetical protein HDU97_004055 [Phlyctochytrium planicorne]|nr:hypothetical protein HDU97_004055 [Phlyctochytrium planicorne]
MFKNKICLRLGSSIAITKSPKSPIEVSQKNGIIDVDSVESTADSTEPLEAPSTWTSDSEQYTLNAQLGSMEKALSALQGVQKNEAAGGIAGSPLPREAAERKFLRDNRQETRPGASINPTTSSVPVTTRQFLENKAGTPTKLSSTVRVMHAKEDALAYKTPTQQLWDDYWVVRPTVENFDSLVEDRIAKARRSGQFDGLAGKGKPLDILTSDLRHNPFLSDTEMVMNRMLQTQGHVPGWVEMGKEIDEEIAKLKKELEDIWKECFQEKDQKSILQKNHTSETEGLAGKMFSWITGPQKAEYSSPAPKLSGEAAWSSRSRSWIDLRLVEINKKIRDYNLQVPSRVSQKFPLSSESLLQQFQKGKGVQKP